MYITNDELRTTVPAHILKEIEEQYSVMLSIVNKSIEEVTGRDSE